jgi:excisionase family DNA binding protein
MAEPLVIATPEQLRELIREAVREEVHQLAPAPPVNDAPPLEVFLTPAQVTELAPGPKVATVRAAIRDGRLPAERPPGAREYRIKKSDAHAWLAGRDAGASEKPVDLDALMARIEAKRRG